MSESGLPLPPPTFEFLVFSLKTQAELRLGLLAFGEESEGPDLPAARHAIDMLGMLSEKSRGNLSIEEQRVIEPVKKSRGFQIVETRFAKDLYRSRSIKDRPRGSYSQNHSYIAHSGEYPGGNAQVGSRRIAHHRAVVGRLENPRPQAEESQPPHDVCRSGVSRQPAHEEHGHGTNSRTE